jgi:DNA-binding transcriptional regulator LsrR (DeoR family)
LNAPTVIGYLVSRWFMQISSQLHRLLYRVAQAYYVDGHTQLEIAKRFGLSRPKVSRLLQKARDVHVVNISLVPPSKGDADLEHDLEVAYGLEEVVLVEVDRQARPEIIARDLGPAAAECLLRCLGRSDVVAMAWGRTLWATVEALPGRTMPDVTLVQLTGGLGPVDVLEHSTELIRRAAQKLNAKLRLLPAPGIVSTHAAAQALRHDHQVAEVLKLAAQADIAVVGLGVPTPDSVLLKDGTILTSKDLNLLKTKGAVGDIGLRYIDAQGSPLHLESLNERIIALKLEEIRRIPRVIGVGGGRVKHEIVRAALLGGFLDVLVTDRGTGEFLISEAQPKKE